MEQILFIGESSDVVSSCYTLTQLRIDIQLKFDTANLIWMHPIIGQFGYIEERDNIVVAICRWVRLIESNITTYRFEVDILIERRQPLLVVALILEYDCSVINECELLILGGYYHGFDVVTVIGVSYGYGTLFEENILDAIQPLTINKHLLQVVGSKRIVLIEATEISTSAESISTLRQYSVIGLLGECRPQVKIENPTALVHRYLKVICTHSEGIVGQHNIVIGDTIIPNIAEIASISHAVERNFAISTYAIVLDNLGSLGSFRGFGSTWRFRSLWGLWHFWLIATHIGVASHKDGSRKYGHHHCNIFHNLCHFSTNISLQEQAA